MPTVALGAGVLDVPGEAELVEAVLVPRLAIARVGPVVAVEREEGAIAGLEDRGRLGAAVVGEEPRPHPVAGTDGSVAVIGRHQDRAASASAVRRLGPLGALGPGDRIGAGGLLGPVAGVERLEDGEQLLQLGLDGGACRGGLGRDGGTRRAARRGDGNQGGLGLRQRRLGCGVRRAGGGHQRSNRGRCGGFDRPAWRRCVLLVDDAGSLGDRAGLDPGDLAALALDLGLALVLVRRPVVGHRHDRLLGRSRLDRCRLGRIDRDLGDGVDLGQHLGRTHGEGLRCRRIIRNRVPGVVARLVGATRAGRRRP